MFTWPTVRVCIASTIHIKYLSCLYHIILKLHSPPPVSDSTNDQSCVSAQCLHEMAAAAVTPSRCLGRSEVSPNLKACAWRKHCMATCHGFTIQQQGDKPRLSVFFACKIMHYLEDRHRNPVSRPLINCYCTRCHWDCSQRP